MSQDDLADASGVSQQLISQIERGVNDTTKYLPQLAHALGVTVGEIDVAYIGATDESAEEMAEIYEKLKDDPDLRRLWLDQGRTMLEHARKREVPVDRQEAAPAVSAKAPSAPPKR